MTRHQQTLLFILFLVVLFALSFLLSSYMAQRRLRVSVPSDSCVITSCHGLDIACGSVGPEMCTMEYRLGDFCRTFATCGIQDGQCALIDNPTFQSCKSCVTACEGGGDPMAAFACEDQCRAQFLGEGN